MSILKLAEQLAKKYHLDEQNADHYGVDPDTGIGIVPKFENGDLVSYNGRKAVYISKMYWQAPEEIEDYKRKDTDLSKWKQPTYAMIQFLDIPPVKPGGWEKQFNFDYVKEDQLKLLVKKNDRHNK